MTQKPEPATHDTEPATRIQPEAYTDEYYRMAVEGYREFAASGGRRLSARMVRAVALADPRPGQRLLDIACGRGEIVLQGALRGAYGVGIDYAQASMAVSAQSLDRSEELRIGLARMDATRLALQDEPAPREPRRWPTRLPTRTFASRPRC